MGIWLPGEHPKQSHRPYWTWKSQEGKMKEMSTGYLQVQRLSPLWDVLLTSECSDHLNWETSHQVRNTLSTKPSTSAIDFGSILKIGRGRNTRESNSCMRQKKPISKVSYDSYTWGKCHDRMGGLWQWDKPPEMHISFLIIILYLSII